MEKIILLLLFASSITAQRHTVNFSSSDGTLYKHLRLNVGTIKNIRLGGEIIQDSDSGKRIFVINLLYDDQAKDSVLVSTVGSRCVRLIRTTKLLKRQQIKKKPKPQNNFVYSILYKFKVECLSTDNKWRYFITLADLNRSKRIEITNQEIIEFYNLIRKIEQFFQKDPAYQKLLDRSN